MDLTFDSLEDCYRSLFQMKWPDGFECPRCSHRHGYTICTRRIPLYECRRCHKQTSLIAGTIMEGSRTCVRKWFQTLSLIAESPKGINARNLCRIIGVTYKTAWLMLCKIRHGISKALAEVKLSGYVVAQTETYSRQPFHSTAFKPPKERPTFAGVSLTEEGKLSYVKMCIIPDTQLRESFILPSAVSQFAQMNVSMNTYQAQFMTARNDKRRSRSIKLLFRNAQAWINQTYCGIGQRHLQIYLDEFCFRLNMKLKNCSLFSQLLKLCARPGSQNI